MPKNFRPSIQSVRPPTAPERLNAMRNRFANTFIPRWDIQKAVDLPHYDVEEEWLILEGKIRRLQVDEAHGDVIDRLVESQHTLFVAEANIRQEDRTKAIDRVITQGQWHFIHLQERIAELRARVIQHQQQAEGAWLALTGEKMAQPDKSAASDTTPMQVPDHKNGPAAALGTDSSVRDNTPPPVPFEIISNHEEVGA